jgi:hypothetical protein
MIEAIRAHAQEVASPARRSSPSCARTWPTSSGRCSAAGSPSLRKSIREGLRSPPAIRSRGAADVASPEALTVVVVVHHPLDSVGADMASTGASSSIEFVLIVDVDAVQREFALRTVAESGGVHGPNEMRLSRMSAGVRTATGREGNRRLPDLRYAGGAAGGFPACRS